MVMSTTQLAKCHGMNHKVISRMRQEHRLSIKEKLVSSKIVYPLETVAKYFQDDEPESQPRKPLTVAKIDPPKRHANTNKAALPDLSRKMLMLGFASNLESQIKSMEDVAHFFTRKLAKDELEPSLRQHDGKRQSINELKK